MGVFFVLEKYENKTLSPDESDISQFSKTKLFRRNFFDREYSGYEPDIDDSAELNCS